MKRLLAALVAACLSTPLAPAFAAPAEYVLPQRWNDDYQPGSECATPSEPGSYVQAQRRWFDQTDAASVANRNATPTPVKQTVKESRTTVLTVSAKATPTAPELAGFLYRAYGLNYTHMEHWTLGQTVGPYQLPAGKQGKLVWGFMMLDASVQDVRCSPDLIWEAEGAPYTTTAPESRYSELRIDAAPVFG